MAGPDIHTFGVGASVGFLAEAIRMNGERSAKLIFLVDEYNKPIRETLFDFIGEKHPNIRKAMQQAFQAVAGENGSRIWTNKKEPRICLQVPFM